MTDFYSNREIQRIKQLRMFYNPAEIHEILLADGIIRSIHAIEVMISRMRKHGITFPKLRHKRTKHDMTTARELRKLIKSGMKYHEIHEIKGIQPAVISRTLVAEMSGELYW